MNIITKTLAAIFLSGATLLAFSSTVNAQQTQEQTLNQNSNQRVEIRCEGGAYGQPINCRGYLENTASQSASQRQSQDNRSIVYRIENGRVVRVDRSSLKHDMVNTSMNSLFVQGATLASIATAAIGTVALKRRK
jgi:hypothetical protein